jgi:hypothetical protein
MRLATQVGLAALFLSLCSKALKMRSSPEIRCALIACGSPH